MKITLCGSAKFEQGFHYWNEKLTLAGHVVFSLAVFPSYKGKKDWYDEVTKKRLDIIHLKKIDASDAIFIVPRNSRKDPFYIGESTRKEIEHAILVGKHIYSPVNLPPIL